MKTKRLKSIAVLALGIMTAFCLAGCGSAPQPGNTDDKQGVQNTSQPGGNTTNGTQSAGYLFEVNGVSVGVDMNMADLKLGEAKSVFEAPSCAAQGTAYVYDFNAFEIETYPDGKKNLIAYIILKDDTVATPEGIDLSKTKADIIKAYGQGYTESDNRMTYEKDGMKLNFIFNGEDIASIEYVSGVVL